MMKKYMRCYIVGSSSYLASLSAEVANVAAVMLYVQCRERPGRWSVATAPVYYNTLLLLHLTTRPTTTNTATVTTTRLLPLLTTIAMSAVQKFCEQNLGH